MSSDTIKKANAVKLEKDNIRTRNGSLIFLAIGTALATMMIGKTIAIQFDFNWFFSIVSQVVCVVFGYITIDSSVRNNLLASSDGNEEGILKKYFSRKAVTSLIFTILFSLGASWFVGQFSKGESSYVKLDRQINDFSKRDSTNKALAAETLKRLSIQEFSNISNAKNKAKQLELGIVSRGTESWKKDYRSAKNNPNHWLWTCNGKASGCPLKYRQWRDDILNARTEGKKIIADASGTNNSLKKSISNTFAYQVSTDSTLMTSKVSADIMEKERNNNAHLITFLIILITIAAAMSAWSSNDSLNKIRKVYGQQVEESDQLFFDVLEDLCLRLLAQILGIIQGVFVAIDKTLEKIGIDLYEIKKRPIAKIYEDLKNAVDGNTAPNIQLANHDAALTAHDIKAIAAMELRNELEKTTQKTDQNHPKNQAKDIEANITVKEENKTTEYQEISDENYPKNTQEPSNDKVSGYSEKPSKTDNNHSPISNQKNAETHVASGVEAFLVRDKTTIGHYDERKGETVHYNLSQIESRITTYERKINQSKTNLEKAKLANDKRRIIQHEDALTNREGWKVYWNKKRNELLGKMKVV